MEFSECPSKFEKTTFEPLCLKRQSLIFRGDGTNKSFGFSTHTTWETFQKSNRRNESMRMAETSNGFANSLL